jgi:Cupin domain
MTNGESRWRVIETADDWSSGMSTIAADRRPDIVHLATGRQLCQLWRRDEPSANIDHPARDGLFPGPNGRCLWVFVIPPDDPESQTPFHATATTDYGFVLRGSVSLEMQDGSTAVLHQGDAFVQEATMHRWRNRTAEPAVIGLVVIGDAAPADLGGN